MDEAVYQGIIERLSQKGYDPAGLGRTAQVGD
jgi:hypothetical protein